VFGVVIPVGPDEREPARLQALVGELGRHEQRSEVHLIVIDDGPSGRELEVQWPSLDVVRTELRRARRPDLLSAHVAGTLEALEGARGLEFVLKLDTDAAVIRPFAASIRGAFAEPDLGVVGSYDRMSSGAVRDWTIWKGRIDAAGRRWTARRVGRGVRLYRHRRHDRELVARTRAAAYRFAPPGAHCLGGAYAVSSSFLNAAPLGWRPWVGTGLGEDVVVGLLASAAGLRMRSLTGPGEPFALAWRGLPAPPPELAAQGHSIVHSVKRPSQDEERALRHELQSLADAAESDSAAPVRRG
jgi:hypothetical protein